MPELETPPVEKKPSFTQIVAAAAPKDAAELKARTEAAKTGAPPPPTAPAPVAAPPPEPTKPTATPPPPAAGADPDDEILSGKRSPKSEDFRRVKTRAQEAQKERDELQGKLAQLEKQKPSKENDE